MASSLRSAEDAVAQWVANGRSVDAALTVAREQAAALDARLSDDERWKRLVSIARRTADPWFATDWPDTFDPLMLVLPLCKTFDWECARCPVGQQQDERACAHPEVPITRLGTAVSRGERHQAQTELSVLRSMLTHAASGPA